TSGTPECPAETMLTWLMPVRAGWIVTFTSWRSFLTRLAGSEIRTLARSVPSTSTMSVSTTLPVSRPATRTGLPTRTPCASRNTTSIVRCGARKPGPSLARPTRPISPATATITISPTQISRAEERALMAIPLSGTIPDPAGSRMAPRGIGARRMSDPGIDDSRDGTPPREGGSIPRPSAIRRLESIPSWPSVHRRLQQRRPEERDRVINQDEPAQVHDQDRHDPQAGRPEHRDRQGRLRVGPEQARAGLGLGLDRPRSPAERLVAADGGRQAAEEQPLDDQSHDVAEPDHPDHHQEERLGREAHHRRGSLPS